MNVSMIGQPGVPPEPAPPSGPAADSGQPPVSPAPRAPEYGGREGPDPTRYGDWEKNGRCIDF